MNFLQTGFRRPTLIQCCIRPHQHRNNHQLIYEHAPWNWEKTVYLKNTIIGHLTDRHVTHWSWVQQFFRIAKETTKSSREVPRSSVPTVHWFTFCKSICYRIFGNTPTCSRACGTDINETSKILQYDVLELSDPELLEQELWIIYFHLIYIAVSVPPNFVESTISM